MHPFEESGEGGDKNIVIGSTRQHADKRIGHMELRANVVIALSTNTTFTWTFDRTSMVSVVQSATQHVCIRPNRKLFQSLRQLATTTILFLFFNQSSKTMLEDP